MSAIDGVSRQQLIQQALGQIGPGKGGQPIRSAAQAQSTAPTRATERPQVLRPTLETVEQARLHAGVSGGVENPKNAASLNRLNSVLDSGQPLRGDVPRGFYLNLEI